MPSQSVYTCTLARAANVIGGPEALAEYLEVRPIHLHAWMNGTYETPTDVFLKAVDFLLERPTPAGAADRAARAGCDRTFAPAIAPGPAQ